MKILFINKEDGRGGAAQVAQNLALELRKSGHEVRFIVRRKFTDDKNIYELKEAPILFQLRKLFNRDFTNVFSNLRDQILANDVDTGVSTEIVNHPLVKWADIVHLHNIHGNYFKLANIISLSINKPIVWTLHDLWAITGHCAQPMGCDGYRKECGNCPRLFDYQKLLWDNTHYLINVKKEIYHQVKLNIVVPSLWMSNMINNSILNKQNVKIIHNGVDPLIYKRLKNKNIIRKKLKIPINKKIILFFPYGYRNINKGWNHIENIIRHYKNRENIYFIGIGGSYINNKQVLSINSIHNPSIIADYYNSADLLLFPSLSESFGMVPLEASACGTPTVAFPVGVIPEIVKHGVNGYISKYNNSESLVDGINFILDRSTQEVENMSSTNTDMIKEKYTLKIMSESYLKFYEKLKQ